MPNALQTPQEKRKVRDQVEAKSRPRCQEAPKSRPGRLESSQEATHTAQKSPRGSKGPEQAMRPRDQARAGQIERLNARAQSC